MLRDCRNCKYAKIQVVGKVLGEQDQRSKYADVACTYYDDKPSPIVYAFVQYRVTVIKDGQSEKWEMYTFDGTQPLPTDCPTWEQIKEEA